MAFMKYAKTNLVKVNLSHAQWRKISGNTPFTDRSASVDISKFHPDNFLLTHSTIVCSVDTEEPNGVKLGSVPMGQIHINRKFADYWITPETIKGTNSNEDAWERRLLLGTFRTFRGAENYVEHVQVPELSKGKIIDAVARDLGDHIYIDILTATDRKHTQLVADIESGKMAAMSMGCSIKFSICSKCGNVAEDETQLCPCVKYEKGNTFIRPDGKKGRVAELCGHHTDLDSVRFIEASWVENPAFKGAVTHHILNRAGGEGDAETEEKIKEAYANTHSTLSWEDYFMKSASFMPKSFEFDGEGDAPAAPTEDAKKDMIDEMAAELTLKVRERVLRNLKDELDKDTTPAPRIVPEQEERPNENMVQSSMYERFASMYRDELGGRTKSVFHAFRVLGTPHLQKKAALTKVANRDIVAAMYLYDRDVVGTPRDKVVYMALAAVGGPKKGDTPARYIRACEGVMRRAATRDEVAWVLQRAVALKPN